MDAKERIDQLRAELHRHNYNYYVLNAPEITDKAFDDLMRERIRSIWTRTRPPSAWAAT